MPSPIAHGSLLLLVRAWLHHDRVLRKSIQSRPAWFYVAAFGALVAPDLDFAARLLVDHPLASHGAASHSLPAVVLIAGFFTVALRIIHGRELPVGRIFALGTACAGSHLVMDMLTRGRGVMVLWPFSEERISILPLFYGARHSQILDWKSHLITFTTEAAFGLLLAWSARSIIRAAPIGSRP